MTMHDVPPPMALMNMMTSYYVPQMIYVAARLGLADVLKDGAHDVTTLAERTGSHAPTLARLLHALANAGILAAEPNQQYRLTPMGTYLQTDVPGSQRNWALLYGGAMYRAWQGLFQAVTANETPFTQVHGLSFYEYLAQHPDDAALFDAAMDQSVQPWLAAFLATYTFSDASTIVDVGGGHGNVLAAILQAQPTVRGILYDLPHVVAGAEAVFAQAQVMERCIISPGNILDTVPIGGDVYLLARVLLNWNDDHAFTILKNCWQGMSAGSKLVIVDGLMPAEGSASPHAAAQALWDLFLLVQFGSKLRTEAEFQHLLTSAGFRWMGVTPTPSQFHIIEAVRP